LKTSQSSSEIKKVFINNMINNSTIDKNCKMKLRCQYVIKLCGEVVLTIC
jgi:hypothetical protein